jgi:uncharacterized Zn-binding protein involved in type VI secretion
MDCADPADTPTGAILAFGTVFIDKIPAAKQGDQVIGVDVHIVMVPSPGGPIPTPLPHPFVGMIDGGLSSSVNIMGMPAAIQGSTASNNPPHIAMPPGTTFQKPPANKGTIQMGSATVMIGNGGGGGGGGAAKGGETKASVDGKVDKAEGHYLDVKILDKGGKPVSGIQFKIKSPDGRETTGTLSGQIKRGGVDEGDHEIKLRAITKAEWSEKEAAVGDKVKLQVETLGYDDDEEAILEIYVKDSRFADRKYATIESKVKGNKVEEEWEFKVDDKLFDDQDGKKGKGYSNPYYYFVVYIAGLKQRSGFLRYRDWIELELKDENGKTIGGAEYKLHLQNGLIIKGELDNNGYAKVENIPPGKIKVTYDVRKGSIK